MPNPNRREIGLEPADMNVFKNAKPKIGKNGKGKNDQFYLDLFLFSYYTSGMNIIDILLLTKGMIYNDFIDTARTKTKIQERRDWNFDKIEYSVIENENDRYYWENYWIEKHKDKNNGKLPCYNLLSGNNKMN